MSKYIFTLLFAVISMAGSAQMTLQSKHYLLLNDSSRVEGSSLLFRKHNDGAIFLMDMTIPVLADSVTNFRNFHGSFARIPKPLGLEQFALRIRRGNISLFEKVNMKLYSDADLMIDADLGVNPEVNGLATGNKFHYYSMEDGVLKKASVKNLKADLVDYSISWNFMKRYRRNQWLQIGMLAGGAAASAYSLYGTTGQGSFNPITLFGGILAASAILINPIKNDLKWMAVESYNAR